MFKSGNDELVPRAPYEFEEIVEFAIRRKIEGYWTEAIIERVSPVVQVEFSHKAKTLRGEDYLEEPLASYAAAPRSYQPLVASFHWEQERDWTGSVIRTVGKTKVYLPWEFAVIERVMDEEDRFRIIICSRRLWKYGVWNPLKLEKGIRLVDTRYRAHTT